MKMTKSEFDTFVKEVEIIPDTPVAPIVLWKEDFEHDMISRTGMVYHRYVCPSCHHWYSVPGPKERFLAEHNTYCGYCGHKNILR